MSWIPVENPSQKLLDKLLKEKQRDGKRFCPDCGVKPGKKHHPNCDVARCLSCGGQRLSCSCPKDKGYGDVWTGLWPGTMECYEKRLVARWEGPETFHKKGYLTFDYNRL